ncbi:DUF1345 domain-containing protein [Ktedonospora formicarum]|uniref:DUF1345 domain-containing protein n=1 Tax=Ktedonospora formicarum TaxID=2778364 RepID=A0A8J3I6J3_9CHLR|nr:DUF1345 domain-containing protein [Ktedonospora formicarum]GHO46309.1 hypothetical protein KSX_44720 [Ktedonospora formicarum]
MSLSSGNNVSSSSCESNGQKPLSKGKREASRWAAILGTLTLGIIYYFLPARLRFGPEWLLLAIEIIVLLPSVVSLVLKRRLPHLPARVLSLLILGIVTVALIIGVFSLIITLATYTGKQARTLLYSAILLWLFNILVFALWYWEIDGGGPVKRHQAGHQAADLQFPQQVGGNDSGWVPHFMDYLFVSFTAATALSPTDTMPLTRRTKALMMIEALTAMSLIVLLASRAINIL